MRQINKKKQHTEKKSLAFLNSLFYYLIMNEQDFKRDKMKKDNFHNENSTVSDTKDSNSQEKANNKPENELSIMELALKIKSLSDDILENK